MQRARHLEREIYILERSRYLDDGEDEAKVDELQHSLDDTKEQVLSSLSSC